MRTHRNLLVIATCACAVTANIAAYLFNLYAIAHFDDALHAFTLFAITLFVAKTAHGRILIGHTEHTVMLCVAIALIGVGVGALWEVTEWVYDKFTPANSILGKDETITDLIFDALGSSLAALVHVTLWRQPVLGPTRVN